MENLVEVDEYTANVSVPQDTIDLMTAASLKASAQPLANRTKHLHALLEVPAVRTIALPLIGYPLDVTKVSIEDAFGGLVYKMFGSGWCQIIDLPTGVTLTSLAVRVQQSNAGAAGQMNVHVHRQTVGGGGAQLGSTFTFPIGTTVQTGVITIPPELIDKSVSNYHMYIAASTALASSLGDFYLGTVATVTDPRAGIGR